MTWVGRTGCAGCRVGPTPAVAACMRARKRCRASVRSQRGERQSGCRRRGWILLVIRRVCRGGLASSRPRLGDGSSGGPEAAGSVCGSQRGGMCMCDARGVRLPLMRSAPPPRTHSTRTCLVSMSSHKRPCETCCGLSVWLLRCNMWCCVGRAVRLSPEHTASRLTHQRDIHQRYRHTAHRLHIYHTETSW